jgi:ATP/maltotriose-dependent transcriptional regulator MalT
MGMGSVLSERGASEAAQYAADAIALCRAGGSPEQLAAAMPTAAMVCWQVGALDESRAYVAEARPMHSDSRRIARVVLLSTSAGLALADGDIDAAIDFGEAADREATELGVEREVPLIRSVLARALLATGDVVGAAERTRAAIDAAFSITFEFPLAICLETAALVLRAADVGAHELAVLLASADVIRERGERPPPVTLAADIESLRADLGPELIGVRLMDARTAGTLAIARLSAVPPRHSDLREPV